MKKKMMALVLSVTMAASLAGCGSSGSGSNTETAAQTKTTEQAGTAEAATKEEDSTDDDVITISFWHARGSGAHYEAVTYAVENFNATIGAEKGIVVEESYIGGYGDLFAQIQLSVQAGEAPNVVAPANTYIPYLLEDDCIVDMATLDGADEIMSNMMDWVMEIGGNTDGEFHSVPYCRSTPVFYYNKTITDELGIEIGDTITIDELIALGEASMLTDGSGNVTRYGFETFNDFGYLHAGWIYELGSEYMAAEGDAPCVDDGVLLKVLSDWREWVDAGWCRPFDSTDAGDTAKAMFYNGEIVSLVNSCASMSGIAQGAEEAGFELGVAQYPTYNEENPITEIGGAQLAIMSADNSEEEIEASWEFIKYMMSDDVMYQNATTTGYVPAVLSIAQDEEMAAFWEENPNYKVAYDQMLNGGRAQETPYLAKGQDFTQICSDAVSLLIAEQSINAEEAVAQIAAEEAGLWD